LTRSIEGEAFNTKLDEVQQITSQKLVILLAFFKGHLLTGYFGFLDILSKDVNINIIFQGVENCIDLKISLETTL